MSLPIGLEKVDEGEKLSVIESEIVEVLVMESFPMIQTDVVKPMPDGEKPMVGADAQIERPRLLLLLPPRRCLFQCLLRRRMANRVPEPFYSSSSFVSPPLMWRLGQRWLFCAWLIFCPWLHVPNLTYKPMGEEPLR